MTKDDINIGSKVYYARIIPNTEIYEVCELNIRTVEDNFFVGTDKHEKQAYLFSYNKLNKIIFADRNKALHVVKEAEQLNQRK